MNKPKIYTATEMINKLGGHRASIARASETSEQYINNKMKTGRFVKTEQGFFVAIRKDTVFFTKPEKN